MPRLPALAALDDDKRMADYQPYWAARGHLLARAGRKDEAHEALTVAIGLTTDAAVRHYLQGRIATLRTGEGASLTKLSAMRVGGARLNRTRTRPPCPGNRSDGL